jgi:hypothetical protein
MGLHVNTGIRNPSYTAIVGTLAAPGDEELLDERLDVEELDVALLILDHDALDIDVSLFVVELV